MWWHWTPSFAKYVYKNIWSLTPTPCINLLLRQCRQSIELPCLKRQAGVHVCQLHKAQCFFRSKWLLGYEWKSLFWRAFANCDRRRLASSCLSICPSLRMKQLVSYWTDFHEIWCLSIFLVSVEEIRFSLKCDKNNGYFTWRCIYIYTYMTILSWILRVTNISDKNCQNSIQEEIKSRLKSGNACYYSVQNLLSSSLLSKKAKNQDI